MKATLATGALALITAALAITQYRSAGELREQLIATQTRNAVLQQQVQAQTDANARLQDTFEQRINQLQENLQASSQQLVLLSESLQEARGLLQTNAPAANPGAVAPTAP